MERFDGLSREDLRRALEALVSYDSAALERRDCFVYRGRVQVRSERLTEWVRDHGHRSATKAQIERDLTGRHGFVRQPFTHADHRVPSGHQSASYYYSADSALIEGLPVWDRP